MRALIQRVIAAKVTGLYKKGKFSKRKEPLVGEELVSSIDKGLCVLVGFCRTDTEKDVDYMARKILSLRIFEDEMGKRWERSVKDANFDILCVSQFTLYGRLKKNKPDFSLSMESESACELYKLFLRKLGTLYEPNKIKDGCFGSYMQVHIQNDGPVTFEIESPPQNNDDLKTTVD